MLAKILKIKRQEHYNPLIQQYPLQLLNLH